MAQNVTSHRMQKDMLCSSKSSCCTSIIPALRKAKAGQPVQALSGQFNNLVRPRLKIKYFYKEQGIQLRVKNLDSMASPSWKEKGK